MSIVSIAFLVTTLIVVATPGTGVIYTLSVGLSRGRRASMVAAIGCTLGIVPHMIATIAGLAALLHTSALAFQVLKYLGVAYLLYMLFTFVIFAVYGTFAASVRDHVISRPRVMTWIRRIFAGSFAALGTKLAFTDR